MDFFILAYYQKMEGTKSNNNGNQIDEDVSIDRQSTTFSSKKRKRNSEDHKRDTSTSGGKGNQLANQIDELLSPLRELVNEIENNHKLLVKAYEAISEEYKLLIRFLGNLETVLFGYVDSNSPVIQRINNLTTEYNNLIAERNNLLVEKDNLLVERNNLLVERNNLLVERRNLRVENDNLKSAVPRLGEMIEERKKLMYFLKEIEQLRLVEVPSNQSVQDRVDAILNQLPLI